MTVWCTGEDEARQMADQLRAMHRGEDWVVRIHRPLFAGDRWMVTVGA